MLFRERIIFADIQASQHSTGFPVAEAGFGAAHNTIGIRVSQLVPVPAHPAAVAGRTANHKRVIGNRSGHDAAGSDKAVSAKGGAAYDGGIGADRSSAPDQCFFIEGPSVDFGSRVGDVGEHTAWTEKHIILDFATGVDGYVVLNFDIIADHDIVCDVHVLSEGAVFTYTGAGLYVTEVPDAGAFPDFHRSIHPGGFMNGDTGKGSDAVGHGYRALLF